MNKLIAFFLLFIFMCANTSIGQLIKVPNLMEHYKEHKNDEANFSISFIEFIKLHYLNNSHSHQNDHHDLPFKTIETFSFVIGLVSFEKFQIQIINEQNFIKNSFFYNPSLKSNLQISIWLPPKIA